MCSLGKRTFITFDTVFFSPGFECYNWMGEIFIRYSVFFFPPPPAWRVSLNLLLSFDF